MSAYGNLCTEFYDFDKPQAPPAALTFYAEKASKVRGRILEPMCGSGRFLIPLAHAGHRIDGTDASPSMISACRRRLAAEGLQAGLFEQPLERLSLPHRYGLAFIPSGSIGLIATDDVLSAALSRLRAHLELDAVLLLEFSELDNQLDTPAQADLEPRSVLCVDGAVITYTSSAHRLDESGATLFSGKYVKSMDGRVIASEDEELVVRSYSLERMRSLLRESGFKSTEFYKSADIHFLEESGCVLVEAT